MTDLGGIADILRLSGVEARHIERLVAYADLVLVTNRSVNLTAAREPAAFAEQLLDALALAPDVDGPLIDIGAGAGLPGIPLAIVTGQRVVLVDSVKKKAAFLRRALAELAIGGEARDARAESLAHDPAYRGQFACATARAVASAPSVAELTVPFLAINGRALLQRGAMDGAERRAVIDAAPMLGAEFLEERNAGGERRLVILRKVIPTQQRFPRREGIPQKRPLCFTALSR